MKLRLSRDAQQDIQSAYNYQAAESPSAATALVSDIRTAIRYIERQPRGSHKTDVPNVYAKVVRGRPYKIFYRRGNVRQDRRGSTYRHHPTRIRHGKRRLRA